MTCKWLITMVSFRPLSRIVGPLPNGRFMAYKWGLLYNYLRYLGAHPPAINIFQVRNSRSPCGRRV